MHAWACGSACACARVKELQTCLAGVQLQTVARLVGWQPDSTAPGRSGMCLDWTSHMHSHKLDAASKY